MKPEIKLYPYNGCIIDTGETVTANDFIFKADQSVDPTDDEGKVPKIEADGTIHRDFLPSADIATLVAGESFSANVPLVVAKGTEGCRLQSPDIQTVVSSSEDFPLSGTATWYIQSITIPAGITSIVGIAVNMTKTVNGGGVDAKDFTLSLRSTETGSDLDSDTQNVSSGSGTHWRTFVFGSSITVTPGNTYYIVFRRSGAGTGGFTDGWNGSASGVYSGGLARVSTDSGSTWGNAATVADFSFKILAQTTAGRIYAAVNDNFTENIKDQVVGFSESAVVASADPVDVVTGRIMGGFSGLTIGSVYYLQDDGTIATTTGTGKKLGLAVAADKLLLNNYA